MEPAGVFEECLHEMYGPVRVFEWSAQDSESKQPRLLRDFNLKSDSSQQPRISLLYTGPGQYSALRRPTGSATAASAALPIDVSGFCCDAVLCCALLCFAVLCCALLCFACIACPSETHASSSSNNRQAFFSCACVVVCPEALSVHLLVSLSGGPCTRVSTTTATTHLPCKHIHCVAPWVFAPSKAGSSPEGAANVPCCATWRWLRCPSESRTGIIGSGWTRCTPRTPRTITAMGGPRGRTLAHP